MRPSFNCGCGTCLAVARDSWDRMESECDRLLGERDRARATAVTLEQELARIEARPRWADLFGIDPDFTGPEDEERVAADDLWRENRASLA